MWLLRPPPVPQQAQPGAGHRHDDVVVLGLVDEVVLPVAEEDEVVVAEPPQELRGPRRLARTEGQHAVLQLVSQLVTAVPHRSPVGDRDPDVVERGDEVLAKQLQGVRVTAVDLDVDPGLVGGPVLDPDVTCRRRGPPGAWGG